MTQTIPTSLGLQRADLLRTQAWLGGEWVDADSGDTFAVTNLPAGNYVIYCTIHSASMHLAISVN